jgi:hypothetical protein
MFPSLQRLDLSDEPMQAFSVMVLRLFPSLRSLNLSHCGLDELQDPQPSVVALSSLQDLDLTGCPLTYLPSDLFRRLESLSNVRADNYEVCCPALLPENFNAAGCRADVDEIFSCDNLLGSNLYRAFLAILSALSLLGNMSVLSARLVCFEHEAKNGFEILTVTLCMSDLLMGMYLAMIGVADRLYLFDYVWRDVAWRSSAACKTAGFLSVVSNEVSY